MDHNNNNNNNNNNSRLAHVIRENAKRLKFYYYSTKMVQLVY
ncbi:MAG: hypothetical protein N7Q72_07495 [Spiroplasma sp. Tabriz.8]|nr:hypothetical protein [Candidatus Regiella insecticola]MCZ8633089.1 hypothetical protein [Spiroplasma sp. Tabriz.8]